MNKFLHGITISSGGFTTFDDHIAWLENKIKENENCIKECSEEIEEDKKELEEVMAEKKAIENNPETYKPSIYLNGWTDTEKKKQVAYDWAQAHEIKRHGKLVGNFCKGLRAEHLHPEYEFITAHSNTSKIRYVRCKNCYEDALKNCYEDQEEKYQVLLLDE